MLIKRHARKELANLKEVTETEVALSSLRAQSRIRSRWRRRPESSEARETLSELKWLALEAAHASDLEHVSEIVICLERASRCSMLVVGTLHREKMVVDLERARSKAEVVSVNNENDDVMGSVITVDEKRPHKINSSTLIKTSFKLLSC